MSERSRNHVQRKGRDCTCDDDDDDDVEWKVRGGRGE